MNKLVVSGCSISSGSGFNQTNPYTDCPESEDLWVNQCSKNIKQLESLELINLSKSGHSNTDIFTDALELLTKHNDIEYLLCAWTSSPRYKFSVGFELYQTSDVAAELRTLQGPKDHNLNNIQLKSNYIQEIVDKFRTLHHLQYEIVKLIRYVNIINNLAMQKNVKLININAWCPWDSNFFNKLTDCSPTQYTKFTQDTILNIHSRSDDEIFKLYTLQHKQYDDAGTIQEGTWANLYNSYATCLVDYNHDRIHPGVDSNREYFNIINTHIQSKYPT